MEPIDYLRFLGALIFVLGLIGIAAVAARRFGLAERMGALAGSRRLDIVETRMIDARRRLVLVRRDRVEHLILLGTGQDLVIETGISPPADRTAVATDETATTKDDAGIARPLGLVASLPKSQGETG